jgi:hypothetical protein
MRGGAFPAMDLKDQSIIIAKTMKLADNPADRISIVKDLLKDSKHTELLKDIFSTEEQLRGDIVVGVAASGETELLNYFTQLMNKLQPVIPKEVEDRGVRDQSDPKSLTSPLTLAGHQKIPINSNQSIEITSPKSQQILSEKMLTSKNKKEDLEYPERFYSLPSFKSLEDASEQERKISENLPLNRTSSIQSRSRSNSSASIAEDFVGEESGSLTSSMVSLQNVDTEGISPELLIRRSASQTQIASENNDPLNKPRSQSVPNLKQLTDPNLPTELVKHTESSQDVSQNIYDQLLQLFLAAQNDQEKKEVLQEFLNKNLTQIKEEGLNRIWGKTEASSELLVSAIKGSSLLMADKINIIDNFTAQYDDASLSEQTTKEIISHYSNLTKLEKVQIPEEIKSKIVLASSDAIPITLRTIKSIYLFS